MNQQNNQRNQYTNPPNFGTTYPKTQYRGYTEEEGNPYGNISNMGQTQNQTNQYSYTANYQGNNPYHNENRFSNVRYHGSAQATGQYPQGMGSEYSTMGQTPYQATTQYQGMSQQYTGTTTMMPTGQQQATTAGPQFSERDRINDLLSSEKYLTEGYNISTFEASNPQLHNTLKNILNETHKNREILHQTMQQRGWYETEPADQQQVSQTYSKFNSYKNQLPF